MAAIHDLLAQIQDESLRERIEKEVNKLSKTKKFGLVFEEHLPECTPLYDMPIKVGCNVMMRNSKEDKSLYVVLKMENEKAICGKKDNIQEQTEFEINEIVRVAEFGEPIYPYLKPIDSVCNAPDSDLWHTLIEADNYHALQLLEYLYAGKVDCIYIDPPYNTGAKDWKYNNDYVDGSDSYRHSKWLSFMEKRLKLAKKLLNPKDSTMIITIDEKEYLHLGCLLEEVFPDANIQMITTIINPRGTARNNEFRRTNEYIFFVMLGEYHLYPTEIKPTVGVGSEIPWRGFIRSSAKNIRSSRPGQFYAIYVDDATKKIVKIGDPLAQNVDRNSVESLKGCTTVFPIRNSNGVEMLWSWRPEVAREMLKQGYLKVGAYNPEDPMPYYIKYVTKGVIEDIDSGKAVVDGYDDDGAIIAHYDDGRMIYAPTVWNYPLHDSRQQGHDLVRMFIGERFDFPKSLYAVRDCLNIVTKDKKNALIVDFFAGSGTTMHAVNLLNESDGGKRRCICVTNNEVSETEESNLRGNGIFPGDEEWSNLGIARYVTWPRIKCSISGKDIQGSAVEGKYMDPEIDIARGFSANVCFFKLGFLDKTSVALGLQFKEMLPTLWMKAGAIGKCPELIDDNLPDMLILPDNKFAVLINENAFAQFEEELLDKPDIQTVYLITDYEVNYRSMAKSLGAEITYQLYRDYLDNFRINHGRN